MDEQKSSLVYILMGVFIVLGLVYIVQNKIIKSNSAILSQVSVINEPAKEPAPQETGIALTNDQQDVNALAANPVKKENADQNKTADGKGIKTHAVDGNGNANDQLKDTKGNVLSKESINVPPPMEELEARIKLLTMQREALSKAQAIRLEKAAEIRQAAVAANSNPKATQTVNETTPRSVAPEEIIQKFKNTELVPH